MLERNQLEPLAVIPPVDPPGQPLSKPSVAVVNDYRLPLVHADGPRLVSCTLGTLTKARAQGDLL